MADTPRKPRSFPLRFSAILLAVVLVAVFFLPFFSRPQPAQAFPGEAMAAQVWRWVKDRISEAVKTARKYSADVAFKNALKVYLTKVAEDTAVWLASAGTGQKPLFVTNPNYFQDLTDAAAGDFLDTLATKNFGIDVCKPVDLRTQFSIESAVRALVQPENFCQNQCQSNYDTALKTDTFKVGEDSGLDSLVDLPTAESIIQRLESGADTCAENGANIYSPDECPAAPQFVGVTVCGTFSVGTCLEIYERDVAQYKSTADQDFRLCMNLCSANKRVARCTFSQISANAQRLGGQIKNKEFIPKVTRFFDPGENDIGQILTLAEKSKDEATKKLEQDAATRLGIQPLVDQITGETKTPPELTKKAAEGLAEDPSGSIFGIYTGSPVADAIGVFTNTLTKRLLQRIFSRDSGGFNPGADPRTSFALGGGATGAQAARIIFSSLAQTEFNSGGVSATLAELAACPETNPGPNNCVIEEGFRQAIERGMTVQEAVEAQLLHADWPIGFEYSAQGGGNIEPSFKEGYPYRSILILRRLRVLPVGWELAAQFMRDVDVSGSTAQSRSLGALLQLSKECGQNNTTPSSFCGLIDPNWVLKSPETFCRYTGATADLTSLDYTPDPLYPDAPQVRQIGRVESCVDEQTCLEEDENGNCRAFGYCIEERPSWKFGGTKCTPSYRSCEAFVDSSGAESAYLANTLNYDGCTATNAGCTWYCSQFDPGVGDFTCTPDTGFRERFTNKVASCPPTSVGCSEYIRTKNTTNLIANGGFEILGAGDVADDGVPDVFPGWTSFGVDTEALSEANSGGIGARVEGSPGEDLQNTFDGRFPLNGQSTTLTFFGKAAAGACDGTFGMRTEADGVAYFNAEPVSYGADWQRFTTTLTYDPALNFTSTAITAYFNLNNCAAIIDDVQLEYGTTFSSYKEYGSTNTISLNGDRRSCRAEEVGCDLYTSATDRIPGVVTTADVCPADQVGCRAFLEVPISGTGVDPNHAVRTGKRCSLDQSRSCTADADCTGAGSCLPSVSILPQTGATCAASHVGCEEFTNLDEVARGGEGKEYYTYIRECVKPTGDVNNEKTYYTWIGSQETGFQLKSYLLKPTAVAYSGPGDTVGGGPAYNAATDPTDPNLCNRAIHDGGDEPDCRKFYDANLNEYYRLYSRTISVSNDCHPLRNTIDGQIYNAIPSEGVSCPASAAQCREYRGASGFNTRTILTDDFDDGDTVGWDGGSWSTESLIFGGGSALAGGTFQTNATLDVAGQLEQGRSYLVTFWAGSGNAASDNATVTARFSESPPTEFFAGSARIRWDSDIDAPLWNFYTLGPLHLDRPPETGAPFDRLQFAVTGGNAFFIDAIKFYEVADNLYLIKNSADLCTGNENCDRYLNRANETFTLKSFTRLCSEEVVGCEALINTQNSDSPFTQTFQSPDGTETKTVNADVVDHIVNDPAKTCRSEEQGCMKLGAPTLNIAGDAIERFDTVFLVNDPDQYATTLCWSKEVGCEEWRSKVSGDTAYFHRPDPFTCELKTYSVGGESFTDWVRNGRTGLGAGDACLTVDPAPDPANGIVPVVPYTQPTWSCKDNPAQACRQNSDCPGAGNRCISWAGLCPSEQSGCREYRDTEDPANCRPECLLTLAEGSGEPVPVNELCAIGGTGAPSGCRGYWYLQQSVSANASECNGVVDEENGCRQFFTPDR